jgi:hypothetical protein
VKLNATVGIALAVLLAGCGSANAETLKLSAAADSKAAAKAVLAYAAKDNYANAEVYDKQVFQMSLGTEVLGTLVSGSGLLTTDGRENSTCFVALVKLDSKVALTPTVGVGEWEAESCLSIDAVGLVSPQPVTGFGRVVVIHSGAAGNTETASAVILAWNSKARRLELDLGASKKAGLAGATTIAAVKKAIQ